MKYLSLLFAMLFMNPIMFSQSLLGSEWFVNEIKVVTNDTIVVADVDNSDLLDLTELMYNFETDSTYFAINVVGDTVYGTWSDLESEGIIIDNYLGTIDFLNDDISILKRMFEYSDGAGNINTGLSLIYLGKERIVSSVSVADNTLNLSVYPNPASDFVDIEYSKLSIRPLKLNVYDYLGREVLKVENLQNNSNLRLNVSNFNSGYFVFEFIFSDKILTRKILIK
jgi:hypothetical protein